MRSNPLDDAHQDRIELGEIHAQSYPLKKSDEFTADFCSGKHFGLWL